MAFPLPRPILSISSARGQLRFEQPPIDYPRALHSDPAARLGQRLDTTAVPLARDGQRGYLTALLGRGLLAIRYREAERREPVRGPAAGRPS